MSKQHGTLEMVLGPKQIESISFSETLIIGRDQSSCHLILEDSRISALHCRIEVQRGNFMLIDLGSANGTHVNDERATRKELASGDLIKLGNFVLMFSIAQGKASKLPKVAKPSHPEGVTRTVAPHRDTRAIPETERKEASAPLAPTMRDEPAKPTAPTAQTPVFAQGKRFGRFEILDEIGRGGMGVIYRVRDIKSKAGRIYALKALPGGAYAAREVVERFQDEARALARIKVDGVVRIYQIGEQDGTPFYVMDFVDGETLEDRLKSTGVFDPEDALRVIQEVATIIGGVHQTGMIHRDLTPNNVIYDKEKGKAHLVDFGLARDLMVRERLTRTGELVGTPHYVSPEQAEGDLTSVDLRTDIYAMGAILYRMLTGNVPFDGESVPQIVMKVLLEEVTPPRTHVKSIPPLAEAICLHALDKEKEARYHSAQAMAADIAKYFAGEPMEAKPLTIVGRGLKMAWRIRLLIGLACLLLIFVVGLTVNYLNQIRLMRAYRHQKIALFVAGGYRSLKSDSTPKDDQAWWQKWTRDIKRESARAEMPSLSWDYKPSPFIDESESLVRLKRCRNAMSLFQATLDIAPQNKPAKEGYSRAEKEIAGLGAKELDKANGMLARERVAGAIFYALRALRFLPQLAPEHAKQASEILNNAQQSTRIIGDPAGLRVRVFRPEAPSVVDIDAKTPFQTRRAGQLIFAVGPPEDPMWINLLVEKRYRTLQFRHRHLPRGMDGWFRLARSKLTKSSEVQIRTGAYLRPVTVNQEDTVLLHEQANRETTLQANPRTYPTLKGKTGGFLCKGLGGRLPRESELHAWFRHARPAVTGNYLATTADGSIAAFRWSEDTLRSAGDAGLALLVIEADNQDRARKLWAALDTLRSDLRATRESAAKNFEKTIAQAMSDLHNREHQAARTSLGKLASRLRNTKPKFLSMRKTRQSRIASLDWLRTAIVQEGSLLKWLEALASGDQVGLQTLSNRIDSSSLDRLRGMFVEHGFNWYASREQAQAKGAMYYDIKSDEWLTPPQAERIGRVYAGGAWSTILKAAAAGHGNLIRGAWRGHDDAVAAGWAYQRNKQIWQPIQDLWSKDPGGTTLKGSWSVARVTPSSGVLLLGERVLVRLDSPDGREIWRTQIPSLSRNMWVAADRILVKFVDKLLFYRLRDGKPTGKLKMIRDLPVALRADGKVVAVGYGNKVTFHEIRSKKTWEWSVPSGGAQISGLAFDPGGLILGVGYDDGMLRRVIGRKNTPKSVHTTDIGELKILRLIPKDNLIATGEQTQSWFRFGGKEFKLTGHAGRVISLDLFPGASHMVTGATDSRLAIWRLGKNAKVLHTFRGGRFPTYSVAVSRDADWILAVTENGVATLWRP